MWHCVKSKMGEAAQAQDEPADLADVLHGATPSSWRMFESMNLFVWGLRLTSRQSVGVTVLTQQSDGEFAWHDLLFSESMVGMSMRPCLVRSFCFEQQRLRSQLDFDMVAVPLSASEEEMVALLCTPASHSCNQVCLCLLCLVSSCLLCHLRSVPIARFARCFRPATGIHFFAPNA